MNRIVTKVESPYHQHQSQDSGGARLASVLDVSFDLGSDSSDCSSSSSSSGGDSNNSDKSTTTTTTTATPATTTTTGTGEVCVVERPGVSLAGLGSGTKIQLALPAPTAFLQGTELYITMIYIT